MAGRYLQNWRRIWLAAINVRLTAAAQAIRKPRYTDWPWFFVPLLMLAIIDYAYLRYWAEGEGCKINDKKRRLGRYAEDRKLIQLGVRNPIEGRPILAQFLLSIHNENDQEREAAQEGQKSEIGPFHTLLPNGCLQRATKRTSVPAVKATTRFRGR